MKQEGFVRPGCISSMELALLENPNLYQKLEDSNCMQREVNKAKEALLCESDPGDLWF